MKKPTIVIAITPRQAMGWPCFYCGKPIKRCSSVRNLKKPHKYGNGPGRPCCRKCSGLSSH